MSTLPSKDTGTPQDSPRRIRILVLDVVRGAAILGIVVVNFSLDVPWSARGASLTPTLDEWVGPAVSFFAGTESMTVFSILFGVGFALQQSGRSDRRFVSFYAWRMGWLFLIGIGNRLIRGSDILHGYAMLGVLLLPLHRLSSARLLGLAIFLMAFPWAVVGQLIPWGQAVRVTLPVDASFFDTLLIHGMEFVLRSLKFSPWAYWIGEVLPVMLVGCVLGRAAAFEKASDRQLKRFTAAAIGIGLFFDLASLATPTFGPGWIDLWARSICRDLGTVGLAGAYIGLLMIAVRRFPTAAPIKALALAGRMALTNYLVQGVLFALIFFPFGLGFYGRLGVTAGVLIGLLIFPLQVLFSQWWLGRYRFGPAEWVWRALSYRSMLR